MVHLPNKTTPPQRKPLSNQKIIEMYNEPRSDAEMIEMIAELNSEGVEFHSYDRDTREFVQISYVPGGIMKKVKWYRVV